MSERKVALITGGGTGTGRAIALGLAEKGLDLVINYSRSRQETEETAEAVRKLGVACLVVQADVAQDDQVRSMVDSTIKEFGRLDYVVNSAGVTVYVDMADLEGLTDEHWDRIIDVNVKGIFHVCRAAAPYLKQAQGSIVNITSVAGNSGQGSSIAYAVSKAAAICLTKSLARVLAPAVRVNSVAPGIILTRWVAGREDHVERFGKEKTPLGRVCSAEDVADVVIPLLLSAGMMTGQTVVVDGGMTL
ncbi:MAG: SDR family NAD(P)-dependent oxidoreductase [Negativicutes bacterium]|nr:SDR family NAD(P)-dependent oxidoreductase [Negativicutes bacterium]